MSPTSSPDSSAGVWVSMADTTTGLEPWIRNPNSPESRLTVTVLSDSVVIVGEGVVVWVGRWEDGEGCTQCLINLGESFVNGTTITEYIMLFKFGPAHV